jgi:FkbM family methyltransferase
MQGSPRDTHMKSSIVEVKGIRVDVGSPKISRNAKHGLRGGWYEDGEAKAATVLLQDGDIVLELGGGCGFMSAHIARLGRAARVLSVEADPELIPIMRQTHALNDVTVEIFNEILSDSSGSMDFHVCQNFLVSSCAPPADKPHRKVAVPTASFQARLAEWRPTLMIVDIEGSELELLRQPLPSCVDRIIVEIHEWAYGLSGVKEVMDRMSDLGFAYLPTISQGSVLGYQRIAG